jgi:hypothetical protein
MSRKTYGAIAIPLPKPEKRGLTILKKLIGYLKKRVR